MIRKMHAHYTGLLVTFILLSHETSQQGCICTQNGIAPKRPEPEKNNAEKIETPKKKCCPYNFDGKSCKYVNDRLLCGYNKNLGVDNSAEAVPYGDDCRIYKGRVECGYLKPPFTGLRRPIGRIGSLSDQTLISNKEVSNELINENMVPKSSVENSRRFAYRHTEVNSQGNIKCVEINSNVVCL